MDVIRYEAATTVNRMTEALEWAQAQVADRALVGVEVVIRERQRLGGGPAGYDVSIQGRVAASLRKVA